MKLLLVALILAGCTPTLQVTRQILPIPVNPPVVAPQPVVIPTPVIVPTPDTITPPSVIEIGPAPVQSPPVMTIWSTFGTTIENGIEKQVSTCGACKASFKELSETANSPFCLEMRDVSSAPKWIVDLGLVPVYTWPGKDGVIYTVVGKESRKPVPGATSASELIRLFNNSRK